MHISNVLGNFYGMQLIKYIVQRCGLFHAFKGQEEQAIVRMGQRVHTQTIAIPSTAPRAINSIGFAPTIRTSELSFLNISAVYYINQE